MIAAAVFEEEMANKCTQRTMKEMVDGLGDSQLFSPPPSAQLG
jgi:hypothetical protein